MQTALIAFDSKQFCTILSKMVQDFGFDPISTQTYDDVLSLCATHHPVVFFTDWTLQEKPIAELIHSLTPHPVLIFVSSITDPTQMQKALDIGATEYIMKPFDNDILQSKLSLAGLL